MVFFLFWYATIKITFLLITNLQNCGWFNHLFIFALLCFLSMTVFQCFFKEFGMQRLFFFFLMHLWYWFFYVLVKLTLFTLAVLQTSEIKLLWNQKFSFYFYFFASYFFVYFMLFHTVSYFLHNICLFVWIHFFFIIHIFSFIIPCVRLRVCLCLNIFHSSKQ